MPIKASRVVFEFLYVLQMFSIEINLFLPVNANTSRLISVIGLIFSVPTNTSPWIRIRIHNPDPDPGGQK